MGARLPSLLRSLTGLSAFALALMAYGTDVGESASSDSSYRSVFLGPNVRMAQLKQVLNDWDKIAQAIYQYQPRECVRNHLTMDSVQSLGVYSGTQRAKYLRIAGVSPESEQYEIVSIGTDQLCVVDPSSSGPAWIILSGGGEYRVLGQTSISE